jgi:hypothetical protein
MAVKSDDSDIRETWLKSYYGGNGDPYIEIVTKGNDGLLTCTSVRIAISGGNAPHEVRMAVANLAQTMDRLNLNDHPDGEDDHYPEIEERPKKFCPFCKFEVSHMHIHCQHCDALLMPS